MIPSMLKNAPILLLALAFTACSALAPARPTPPAAQVEQEEQAVYAAYFKDKAGPLVILQDTATDISPDSQQQTLEYIRSDLENLSGETLEDYLYRNRQPSQLSADMQIGVDYVLLSEDELSAIFHQPDGWEIFNQKYPRSGYTVLSRVGFNRSLDQALIYAGHMGGPLSGAGYYYLMEKINGQWELKDQVMVWIS